MGREQSGDIGYEWVNAWAATAMAETSSAELALAVVRDRPQMIANRL